MIGTLTTYTGEVSSVGIGTTFLIPTTPTLGVWGVWCGGNCLSCAGGDSCPPAGDPRLQIQAGCRPADEGAPS